MLLTFTVGLLAIVSAQIYIIIKYLIKFGLVAGIQGKCN